MPFLTVLTVKKPATVGKHYTSKNGRLKKSAVGNITEAIGRTVRVPDAAAMMKLLEEVTSSNNQVIVNGLFGGGEREEFRIYDERTFREIVSRDGGDPTAVLKSGKLYQNKRTGELIGARKKELMKPVSWLLIDADTPAGFPDAWLDLDLQALLELLEPALPGISQAERIELRGSSARVINGTGMKKRSHAWVMVDDATRIELARVAVLVRAINSGASFPSPRHSRTTGEIIGHAHRTAIDLATWVVGRLNFDSAPTVAGEGYSVTDAGIELVNPGAWPLRLTAITDLTPRELDTHAKKTGHRINIGRHGTSMSVEIHDLTFDTMIEVRGDERPLGDWVTYMQENGIDKLRCETPFRASCSEAAFIRVVHDGPFLYDVGDHYTHRLPNAFSRVAYLIAEMASTGGEDEPGNGPGTGNAEGAESHQQAGPGNEDDDGGDDGGSVSDTTTSPAGIIYSDKGKPLPIFANVSTMMRTLPEWAGVAALDTMACKVLLLAPVPDPSGRKPNRFEPRILADTDVLAAVEWFQHNGMPSIRKEAVGDAMITVAAERAFDPLEDRLRSLRWDGIPRLENWLLTYCSARGTELQPEAYIKAVGRCWLISAVARALRPGCKADCALILVGKQGIGKSTAGRILAYDDWFSDALPPLHHKDASDHIRGKWIVELNEMATATKADVEDTKAFLSRNEERFRPPYGRNEVEYKRRCVFLGTTNRDDFLKDETGNRRFWPVEVGQVDRDRLKADRDQIWAEAVHMLDQGARWHLTDEEAALAARQQAQYTDQDERAAALAESLKGRTATTVMACIGMLGMKTEKKDQMAVARMLRSLGWQKKRTNAQKFWSAPMTTAL